MPGRRVRGRTLSLRVPDLPSRTRRGLTAVLLFLSVAGAACTTAMTGRQALPASGSRVPTDPIGIRLAADRSPLWLMGELHDSPHGHAARLADLQRRVQAGWRPALVLEVFDRERQAQLDAARQACADAACLVQRAGGPGWDWALVQPLLQLAIDHRLPLVAANVSRADASRVVKEGLGAVLPEALLREAGWPQSLEGVMAAQQQAVDLGHCGLLPASMLPRMAQAQVARDLWMAHALRQHAAQGAVLIAGNGHVRRDAGVPYWLQRLGQPQALVIGYEEAGSDVPEGRYDLLRQVPPHPRPDPCESLRRSIRPAAGR